VFGVRWLGLRYTVYPRSCLGIECSMRFEYEIFECLPSGDVNWRDSAPDLTTARLLLNQFARDSENDCFGFCLATRELVFRIDGAASRPLLAKRVFQIAYTDKLSRERADLLRSIGYGVLSVIGNEQAKTLLTMIQMRSEDLSFFMIGHAAPSSTRAEMAAWLRARYPSVRIIALNPPNERIPIADYNVPHNGPEWLPIVRNAA
jgi:hypothetical protein